MLGRDTCINREKGWKGKWNSRSPSTWIEDSSEEEEEAMDQDRAPKGYVPVLAGKDEMMERFLLRVKLFNDPRIVMLLEKAADEFGYKQEGILRIPCDLDYFRQVVGDISKPK